MFRFGLPASPSEDQARIGSVWLSTYLKKRGLDVVVCVVPTYRQLGDGLTEGTLSYIWAPPIVCAKVEQEGARVVLRCVRKGATSYRAALVVRKDEELPLQAAALKERSAAWVDKDSAGGYLLARAFLKEHGFDAIKSFRRAIFIGSYSSALQAVASKEADVCSIFAAVDGKRSTLDEVDEGLRKRVKIAHYTGETQNDGVAVGPGVDAGHAQQMVQTLSAMMADADGARVLARLFRCDQLKAAEATPTSPVLAQLVQD